MKTQFFKPKVLSKMKNLNWKQAKARFPLMNPNSDADKDGLMNSRDCKPFNIKRQGKNHKYDDDKAISFEHIKELETIGDVKKLAEDY